MSSQLRTFDPESIKFDLQAFEVGAGAYGQVIVGHHEIHDFVAIKCMDIIGGDVDKMEIEKLIKQEMDLLYKAKHDNIVSVYGYAKWPYAMGLVMEYYRGGNLRQLLMKEDVDVGVLLRLRILAESANGVVFIHNLLGRRLVHGDLKPDNMLLTIDLHCKISDFGSAGMVRYTSGTTAASEESTNYHGTEAFIAPERLLDRGMKPKKEHDTYSFGIITYTVAVRDQPYQEMAGLCDAVISGQRPSLNRIEEVMENLNQQETWVIGLMSDEMQRCWSHDPVDRPPMLEVRDNFQRYLDTQDEATIVKEVAKARQTMGPRKELDRRSCTTPLSQFSARLGRFPRGETTLLDRVMGNIRSSSWTRNLYLLFLLSVVAAITVGLWIRGDPQNEMLELVHQHVTHVRNAEYARAQETEFQLSAFLKANEMHQDLWAVAEKHRESNNYLEAILFYKISSKFVSNSTHPDEEAWDVRGRAWGIMETNKVLVANDKKENDGKITVKALICDWIIPIMDGIRLKIRKMENLSKEKSILCQAWCFHYIEWTQYLIEDYGAMNKTLFLGVNLMREHFGTSAGKHKVFAHLLNNIGLMYNKINEPEKSVRYYDESLVAYKMAEDYADPKLTDYQVVERIRDKVKAKLPQNQNKTEED